MSKEEKERRERPSPKQTVYNQYWKHVRHVEDEMWTFTRIWAVIMTAIFSILGSNLPVGAKVGTAGFGILLCVLGFLIVYSLRVPFFNFFLTIELIAKQEFYIEEPYRRFGEEPTSNLNKGIDIHDILIVVYAITAAILLSVVGSVLKTPFIGITLGIILFSALMVIYVYYILPKFNSSTKELREEIWDNQEQTPER